MTYLVWRVHAQVPWPQPRGELSAQAQQQQRLQAAAARQQQAQQRQQQQALASFGGQGGFGAYLGAMGPAAAAAHFGMGGGTFWPAMGPGGDGGSPKFGADQLSLAYCSQYGAQQMAAAMAAAQVWPWSNLFVVLVG